MDGGLFFGFLPVVVVPLMLLSAAWHVAVLVFRDERFLHLPRPALQLAFAFERG